MSNDDRFVRNSDDKREKPPLSLVQAFKYAGNGLAYTCLSQRNMKIHLVFALFAVVLGFVFSIDTIEWALIVVCIFVVIATECINTAIESVVDLVSPEYSILAKRAKDSAAAAVLIVALMSIVVAAVIFIPHIMMLFVA